jgi:hypothetical protein
MSSPANANGASVREGDPGLAEAELLQGLGPLPSDRDFVAILAGDDN